MEHWPDIVHMTAFSYSSFCHFVQMKEFISWLLSFLPSFLSLFFPSFLGISEPANITNPSQVQQMKSLWYPGVRSWPSCLFSHLHILTALSRSLFIFPSFALGLEGVTLPMEIWICTKLGCPCTGMLHSVCAWLSSKAPYLTNLHMKKKTATDSEQFVQLPKGTWSWTPELEFYPYTWHGAWPLLTLLL